MRVHVLQHRREQWRPSSTGGLVGRVVAGSSMAVFHRNLTRADVLGQPGPMEPAPWILHPRGEGFDEVVARAATPPAPAILLIDGSWTESGRMLQFVQGWGRPVRLHLGARSRYRLREQKDDGHLSTAEALIGWYEALGLDGAAELLRLHLELRVYVGLRSRGRKAEAEDYLSQSPIRTRLGSFLDTLHERRPNLATLPGERQRSSGQDATIPGTAHENIGAPDPWVGTTVGSSTKGIPS